METYSLAEAKARLSELVERAAAGDTVRITRRGKLVAQITSVKAPRKRVDVAALRALTNSMSMQQEFAGDFVRKMRDRERY